MAYAWLPPNKNHKPLWPGKLVEVKNLPNGLTLEIWDYSRRLAGDRWLIGMLAQIRVKVGPEHFSAPKNFERFLRETEGVVYYRYRKERHFIDEKEKDRVFETLKGNFLKAALEYLSHPSFRDRLIRNEISLIENRWRWEEEIRRKDEEAERLEELWKDRPI